MTLPRIALLLVLACFACSDGTSVADDGELIVDAEAADALSPVSPTGSSMGLAGAVGDPSSYIVSFYQFYVAADADCSSPSLLGDHGSTPLTVDLLTDPTLFTVRGPRGSYDCIAMRISDVLSFVPATSFGPCVAGDVYRVDTYRVGENDWRDVTGVPITGSGSDASPQDDQVDIFFTTDPASVIARGYSSNQVVPLVSGAVIPGRSTFVYDVRGQVQDEGGECRSAAGRYGFK